MNTTLDCIPCIVRQGLEAARFATNDAAVHEQILRELLQEAAVMDLALSPPAIAQQLHRRVRQLSGMADPYLEVKNRFNAMASGMLPVLAAEVSGSDAPLFRALRLAIAGNIIDLGVRGDISESEARSAIDNTLNEPFHGDMNMFRDALQGARSILYLADNAGEIVFDRLLIEQLPTDRVTVAVRGGAVVNDATRADAAVAGLCDLVEVIDNGSDAPGTILSDCSREFRKRFESADLVIAKGQGNYESLSGEDADIFFLFKVKCSVISAHVGLPVGTHVLQRQFSEAVTRD